MDVWFCVTRRNRAERHNREVMNTLSETTRRSPERYGKALPHLTKTYHGSPELALVYDTEKQKGHANRASIAVARKLVAYLLAVDRSGREFVVAGERRAAA